MFVKPEKGDFIGKQALIARESKWQFITMRIEATHAAPHGGDPIFADGQQIGSITSAGYGARADCTIGFGFVSSTADLSSLQVGILGERFDATLLDEALYDPQNSLVKGQ